MGALTLVPIAAMLSLRFRKHIGEMMPLSMFVVLTFLYLSGIITTFLPGLFLCYILSGSCLLYCIYVGIRIPKRVSVVFSNPCMVAFVLFFFYFFLISYGRDAYWGDDLHCWAAAVRDFFAVDDYSNFPGSLNAATLYPPTLPLWNYYSARILGQCPDWSMFLSQHMMLAVLTLPLFTRINGKNRFFKTLAAVFIILCIPILSNAYMPYGILHDGVLQGVFSAYMLWKGCDTLITRSKSDLLCCVWSIFFLTLTKEIALATAAIGIFVLLLGQLFFTGEPRPWGRLLTNGTLMIASWLAAIISWQFYLALPVEGDISLFNSSVGVLVASTKPVAGILQASPIESSRVVQIFHSVLQGFYSLSDHHTELREFFRLLFNTTYESGLLALSIPTLLLLLGFLFFLVQKTLHHDTPPRARALQSGMMALVLAIHVPLCLFTRGFRYVLSPGIVGVIFTAHVSTFPIIALLFFLYYLLSQENKHRGRLIALSVLGMLLFVNVTELVTLAFDKPQNTILDCAANAGVTLTKTDNVLFVQTANASLTMMDQDIFLYKSYPAGCFILRNLTDALPEDVESYESRLSEYLMKNKISYVYLAEVIDVFRLQYKTMFDSYSPIQDYSLYRVVYDEAGSIRLEYIGHDVPNAITYRFRRLPE